MKTITKKEAFEKLGKTLGFIFEHTEKEKHNEMISSLRHFTKGYLDAEKLWEK